LQLGFRRRPHYLFDRHAPTHVCQEQLDEQRQYQSIFDAVARGRVGLT
jgi:hypothetical protein